MTTTDSRLTMSNGQLVLKDSVGAGDFLKNFNIPKSGNSYFLGSFEELEEIVTENFHNNEPGTGSVDGDVLLINVPAARFMSTVAEITDENIEQVIVEEYVRSAGEKPVFRNMIHGEAVPAKFVQIVVYRADVLAQDNSRSTDHEWEIITILAKIDEVEPMHPTTMERNSNHDAGGTYREYTEQQWNEAYRYWANHAYIIES